MTRTRHTRAEVDAVLEVLRSHIIKGPGPGITCACGRNYPNVHAWQSHILTLAEGARLLSHIEQP